MTEPILNARIGRVRPAWSADTARSAVLPHRSQDGRTDAVLPASGAPPQAPARGLLRLFVGACLPAPLA
ncbi:MAG TPA: hypothetical protein VNK91_10275, partial [Burkholderiaceae bacterium]|nr:hypothetical protein [Burkholderiaceae bacterium]